MKDSAGRMGKSLGVAGVAVILAVAACSKSNKANDVAQDSILVKDADVAEHKTDTAGAATAALVRERGASGAQLPALTTGAPVTRAPDVATPPPTTQLTPPRRVNPSPVLPPREPRSGAGTDSVTHTQTAPRPTVQTPPVTQPVSPSPPPVPPPLSQPIPPAPKKDTSTDSLRVSRS